MSLPPSRMPTNSFCSLSCSCKVQRRTRFAGSCPRACCKSLVTYWSRRKYSIECHTTGWLCPTKLPETVIPALGEVVSSVSAADCGVVHVPLVCWKYRRDASKSQRRNRRLVAGRVISRWSRLCSLRSRLTKSCCSSAYTEYAAVWVFLPKLVCPRLNGSAESAFLLLSLVVGPSHGPAVSVEPWRILQSRDNTVIYNAGDSAANAEAMDLLTTVDHGV